jgi:hypothetical protein
MTPDPQTTDKTCHPERSEGSSKVHACGHFSGWLARLRLHLASLKVTGRGESVDQWRQSKQPTLNL